MTAYIIKLLVLLPIMGGLIFAALWLYRKYQPALMRVQKESSIKMLETLPLGNFAKLLLIEFEGQKILLSATRGRVERIAEKDRAT
tara:strand:- start:2681 stop:2938 length:258 start_codon:yes stop_codon:yes gene_type:complete